MEPTTGLILRRITETALSVSAHKLATVILDGIAWKDGYDGLPRGTAAFTLAALAEKMGVSRQHLSVLLGELETSGLKLERRKPHGKYAPWLFRFAALDASDQPKNDVSGGGDTSPSLKESNKTVFSGQISIGESRNVFRTCWAALIQTAKTALPCWNVDTQLIWDRFLAFNRARGNATVPAGYLLGFMRRWRTSPTSRPKPTTTAALQTPPAPQDPELLRLIKAAPGANREFHASDLCALIGQDAYEARIRAVIRQFGCLRLAATFAVHGRAVMDGEIGR